MPTTGLGYQNDMPTRVNYSYFLSSVPTTVQKEESKKEPPIYPPQPSQHLALVEPLPAKPLAVRKPPSTPIDADFERFWTAYPAVGTSNQRVGKKEARAAYAEARRSATAEELQHAVEVYPFPPAPKYRLHCVRWLRRERWKDETDHRNPSLVAAGLYDAPQEARLLGKDEIDFTGMGIRA